MGQITPVEKKHFSMIYNLVSPAFPRNCTTCGRNFKNELDYNLKTAFVEKHADNTEFGLGFIFSRNHIYRENERRHITNLDFRELESSDCPTKNVVPIEICGTTQSVILNGGSNLPEWDNFLTYIRNRARREGLSNQEMIGAMRRNYHQYLVEREAINLIYISSPVTPVTE